MYLYLCVYLRLYLSDGDVRAAAGVCDHRLLPRVPFPPVLPAHSAGRFSVEAVASEPGSSQSSWSLEPETGEQRVDEGFCDRFFFVTFEPAGWLDSCETGMGLLV